jgi:hypothetical protein
VKRPAVLISLCLFLLSALFVAYRVLWLGYPLFPTIAGQAWQLTVDAYPERASEKEEEVSMVLGLPSERPGRALIEEKILSGELNFNLLHQGPVRIGVWSGPITADTERISYQATIVVRPQRRAERLLLPLGPDTVLTTRDEEELAGRVMLHWKGRQASMLIRAALGAVNGQWGSGRPPEEDLRAWSEIQARHGKTGAFLILLHSAAIPARTVEGLRLSEGVYNRTEKWVEAWDGRTWEAAWPETGKVEEKRNSLLPLAIGGPAFRFTGPKVPDVTWSLSREVMSNWRIHLDRVNQSGRLLDRWSLFRLPAEFQQTFRVLLLVPIGALMISVLRNIIGFPTFGVFMPVLVALAFRSTGPGYGLAIFAGVVFVGYLIRRFLDKLHLLLVPRMSVLLTVVIGCFTVLALLGSHLSIRPLMAVGLIPFVILTMVIERFFVILEEEGALEGFRAAAGSAAVALITYAILGWEPLQLTFFVYPELLACVAGLQILLGRYTGYRLSELLRFRFLGRQ